MSWTVTFGLFGLKVVQKEREASCPRDVCNRDDVQGWVNICAMASLIYMLESKHD